MVRSSRRLEFLAAACMAVRAYAYRLSNCKGTLHCFLAVMTTSCRANNSDLVAHAARISCDDLAWALSHLRHRGIRFRPWFRVVSPTAWERAMVSKMHIRVAMRKLAMARVKRPW